MSELEKEVNEIHSYLRHSIQIFLTWYTFFITANLVGLEWFVSQLGEDKSISFEYYLFCVVGFLVVNILAFLTSFDVKNYRLKAEKRVRKIREIPEETNSKEEQKKKEEKEKSLSALPFKLYETGIWAVQISLICVSVVWFILVIIVLQQMLAK